MLGRFADRAPPAATPAHCTRHRFLERQSMWDAWERFKMKDVKGWKMNDSWLKTSPRYLAPEHRFDTYSGGT